LDHPNSNSAAAILTSQVDDWGVVFAAPEGEGVDTQVQVPGGGYVKNPARQDDCKKAQVGADGEKEEGQKEAEVDQVGSECCHFCCRSSG
jgi:hypothetical protein